MTDFCYGSDRDATDHADVFRPHAFQSVLQNPSPAEPGETLILKWVVRHGREQSNATFASSRGAVSKAGQPVEKLPGGGETVSQPGCGGSAQIRAVARSTVKTGRLGRVLPFFQQAAPLQRHLCALGLGPHLRRRSVPS